jgi:fructokinase
VNPSFGKELLNMYDIVSFGELLIDFTESGLSAAGMRLFEQNPGGAVANLLCAASQCDAKTAFIGKVGNDMHGRFLKQTMIGAGVDMRGLIEADDVFTTLAFVSLAKSGEREFSFARKPGADTCLRADELDLELLQNTRVFHSGSLSLTQEPARSATYEAIDLAKAAGAVISYDPTTALRSGAAPTKRCGSCARSWPPRTSSRSPMRNSR